VQGVIFIGPQASGKSTFYIEQFYKTHIRINLDMLKTRHREMILLRACVDAKQSVVIDNTNPTVEERRKYLGLFKMHKFEVVGYYFSATIDQCLQRNQLRSNRDRIPEVGIKATFKKLQPPHFGEGFDRIFVVNTALDELSIREEKNEV
jgi:predicted kinase